MWVVAYCFKWDSERQTPPNQIVSECILTSFSKLNRAAILLLIFMHLLFKIFAKRGIKIFELTKSEHILRLLTDAAANAAALRAAAEQADQAAAERASAIQAAAEVSRAIYNEAERSRADQAGAIQAATEQARANQAAADEAIAAATVDYNAKVLL